MISFLLFVIILLSDWFIYKKMGREGWEGIVPIYDVYVLFQVLYGKGWRFLTLLIPIYNIYVIFKFNMDLAKAFNRDALFGVGLVFLPFVFDPLLAFTDAQYKDGSHANKDADIFTNAAEKINDVHIPTKKDDNAVEKLEQLAKLKEEGVISEEEFLEKKEELMKRI